MEHFVNHTVCIRSFWAPDVCTLVGAKSYVCILYGSQIAPLLLTWLGEVQGTSLAMAQCKALPDPTRILMFRVPTVRLRVPSGVPPVGTRRGAEAP